MYKSHINRVGVDVCFGLQIAANFIGVWKLLICTGEGVGFAKFTKVKVRNCLRTKHPKILRRKHANPQFEEFCFYFARRRSFKCFSVGHVLQFKALVRKEMIVRKIRCSCYCHVKNCKNDLVFFTNNRWPWQLLIFNYGHYRRHHLSLG